MSRILRLLLVVLLAVPVLVLAAPAPAQACSCAGGSTQSFVRGSDEVFVATLLGSLSEGVGDDLRIEAEAEVTHVYDGEVPDRVTVSTISQSSACGLTGLRDGQSLLLMGSLEGGVISVGLCGGPTAPVPKNLRVVERVLGPGEPRSPAAPSAGPSVAEPPEDEVRPEPSDRADDGLPPRGWVGLGFAAAVVVLGGAVVVRRRSARD